MKLALSFALSFFVITQLGCSTHKQAETKRYQKQVNRLAKKLRYEKRKYNNLKDENLVLRKLAGVPEPAIKRVRKDGKKTLNVYSEKFLYKQVIKAFKNSDRESLARSIRVFLQQYPKSKRADNAIYYKALLDLRQGRIAESLEEFDKVIDRYPNANKRPAALLGKALAYKALQLNDQAKVLLDIVMKKYPKTPEYIRAKRAAREIEKKLM